MKVLTKEEEQAHYNATLKGGIIGGTVGVAAGSLLVALASRRYPAVRNLTIPLKTFLVTSTGTVALILSADKASRNYQKSTHAKDYLLLENESAAKARREAMTQSERTKEWIHDNRYMLVVGSWAGSIGLAWHLVNRDKFLTGAQKIVQARMYAQGLTLAVICAMSAFEIADQRKRQKELDEEERTGIHHKHPHQEAYEGEDLWKDMIKQEEARENRMKKAAMEKLGAKKEEQKQ